MPSIPMRPMLVALALQAVLNFSTGMTAGAADPEHYRKMSTWQESLLGSVEAIEERGIRDAFETFETGVVRGGEPAVPVRVNVSGATELYLFVSRAPEPIWGVGTWADPKLVAPLWRDGSLPLPNPGRNHRGHPLARAGDARRQRSPGIRARAARGRHARIDTLMNTT